MASVAFESVSKRFGDTWALSELSLDVPDGEFLVLLGPSGCGKTTALRLLAGFERVSAGHIRVDGKPVESMPAGRRDIAMVFQSYALYPHMTVSENLAFGPRVRHEDKRATKAAIAEVAEKLDLAPLLNRKPRELSGGQRQRVALGRALLRRPSVFLMDEPLSNLDAALRTEVRAELNRLHQELGTTTIYVTHDQTEAMSLGDRVAVMSRGTLQQAGTPQDVYDDPVNVTVARFIGSPAMNLLAGVLAHGAGWEVATLGTSLPLRHRSLLPSASDGQRVLVGLRPDEISATTPTGSAEWGQVAGRVEIVERMGAESWITVRCSDATVICKGPARTDARPGDQILLTLGAGSVRLFDAENGDSLFTPAPRLTAPERQPTGSPQVQASS